MGDNRVLEYLKDKGYRRCIDFGGVQRPFASKYVTTYVDLVDPNDWGKRYPGMYEPFSEIWDSQIILGDCEDDETWAELENEIARNGKFDFAISSHMLEHLSDPKRFLKNLPKVADEGYIGIPNKVFELGRGREFTDEGIKRLGLTGSYRGAFPHKWIFTVVDGILWGLPKLGVLETVVFSFENLLKHYEPLDEGHLSIMWQHDLPVRFVTDRDIGFPDPTESINLYRNILGEWL
jgi:SAM-dependent methyltransferase